MRILFVVLFCVVMSVFSLEKVTIHAEDDWYPYSGSIDGQPKGIAEDIITAAYKAADVEVEFQLINYDRGMALVKEGKAIGCFDAPRTKENETTYLWHDQKLFSAVSSYFAKSDYKGTVSSVKDVEGKKLGLTQGYGYGNLVDMNTKIIKEYSKNDEIITKKLVAGRLDYIILFDEVANYLASKINAQGKIKKVGINEKTDIYIAFSKKHPDSQKYIKLFNKGMTDIKKNGEYQKIMDSWKNKVSH